MAIGDSYASLSPNIRVEEEMRILAEEKGLVIGMVRLVGEEGHLVMKQELIQALSHVLWIGGVTDSGKSTVAQELARRHQLQVYHGVWPIARTTGACAFQPLSSNLAYPKQIIQKSLYEATR